MVPAGPWLQYLGQEEGQWLASALIVLPPNKVNMEHPPVLSYSTGGGSPLPFKQHNVIIVFMYASSPHPR